MDTEKYNNGSFTTNTAAERIGRQAYERERNITKREKEILRLAMKGYTTKAIAAELFIETGTVEVHRSNLIKKYQCNNLIEVIVLALKEGWIE